LNADALLLRNYSCHLDDLSLAILFWDGLALAPSFSFANRVDNLFAHVIVDSLALIFAFRFIDIVTLLLFNWLAFFLINFLIFSHENSLANRNGVFFRGLVGFGGHIILLLARLGDLVWSFTVARIDATIKTA
jgi:hypothetical protein